MPAGDAEGEGYLLVLVYDWRDEASELVILDARDVATGPVASVSPPRVPYGFHAAWVPAGEVWRSSRRVPGRPVPDRLAPEPP